MQNLNLSTNLDIKTFLRWWKRELAFFIPKKMRDFFHQPQKMLVIEITETVLHFTYLNDFQNQTLPDLPRQTASSDDFKNLLSSDKNLTDCAICLRLNTMQATSKLLTLPKAAKENINQVILYELDRFTPFKANQIYFTSAQLVSSDNEQINAQILLTPRSLFDNLYSELKKLGITPEFVDVKGVENDFKQKDTIYNLLPPHLQLKKSKTPEIIKYALTFATISTLSAIMILPIWFESQTVTALEQKIALLEKEVKKVNAVQTEIDEIKEETQALISQKTKNPSVLSVFNALSALLKDDTWLAYLQFSEGKLQIQGESPNASSLLGVLENADFFEKASFVSPVTQDKANNLERFQIIADVTKPENPVLNSDTDLENTPNSSANSPEAAETIEENAESENPNESE